MHRVLAATRPAPAADGGPSKAKFHTEPDAVDEARSRVRSLLDRYPLYPEIDLGLVKG
jgi:glycine hydroxymethyltransferase